MTVRKHFKQLVRERMTKTGESYTSARRNLNEDRRDKRGGSTTPWHYSGSVPATTALRVLLAAAGVRSPHDGEPFNEAMLFGICGGVGAGVCAFHYAKENVSTFFIAGRHGWHDDASYLTNALGRFGIEAVVRETAAVKSAEKQLREAVAEGPCVAWVDGASLPHRALPPVFSGGMYHVVTVYRIDEAKQTAEIGDLGDEPVTIALPDLAVARARIRKQKNRVLRIPAAKFQGDLRGLVRGGLAACRDGLGSVAVKGYANMFSLGSFRKWADRLHGSKDKDSWEAIFKPGSQLWTGLTGLYLYTENYGTGGGLCRPLMADFLTQAGKALKDAPLQKLGERYRILGEGWSALAASALPPSVPLLADARKLYDGYAEQFTSNASAELKRETWAKLDALAAQAKKAFPLNDKEASDLRAELQARVRKLAEGEEAAQAAIGDYLK